MAKKQTRKTVSLNKAIYEAVVAEATKLGISCSHFIEELIRSAIDTKLPKTWHYKPKAGKLAEAPATPDSLPLTIEPLVDIDTVTNPCRNERCPIIDLHEEHEHERG